MEFGNKPVMVGILLLTAMKLTSWPRYEISAHPSSFVVFIGSREFINGDVAVLPLDRRSNDLERRSSIQPLRNAS